MISDKVSKVCKVCIDIYENNFSWREHDCSNPDMLSYMDFIDQIEKDTIDDDPMFQKKQYWSLRRGWRRGKNE